MVLPYSDCGKCNRPCRINQHGSCQSLKVLETAEILFCNILYLIMRLSVLMFDSHKLSVKLANVHCTCVDVLSVSS